MDWTEIKVTVPVSRVEDASAIAEMADTGGIYIEDYSDIETECPKIAHVDLIDEDLLKKSRDIAVIHLYITPDRNPSECLLFLKERFELSGIDFSISDDSVKEEDWSTAWKKFYKPVPIGDRLTVVPSWEKYDKKPGETVLLMDPGMAFGTGTHETTRLCIELIEKYIQNDVTLLDVGTGSGILSIASALLGAKKALGIDIDKMAVRVASENAEMNGVSDRTDFICGDLATDVDGRFELITANIVADVIIRLAPAIPKLLKEGGVFIASGIIDAREQDVRCCLESLGLEVIDAKYEKGWVALASRMKR